MALVPGTRCGAYEVLALIGSGGMGEVYRARDTTLNRDVAIKVLPESFATDPDRLARFQREAQVLASLNHPHIAHIHGIEQSGGVRALVMELVEGEDLSQRTARGAIPIDEALPIAKQIAEALEAAHEQGIIHRDLKPANVKVRPDGTVKVLDFGLAKAMDPTGSAPNVSGSPTITTPAMMTRVGTILGTTAYMSPEQARGKPLDRRTDIWSFGCVLFEMLAGRPPFESGETVTDAVASIIKNDPDWQALPPDTPPHIRALLQRSLRKDPGKRLPHIGVARMEIDEGGDGASSMPPPPVHRSHARVAWTIALLATVAAAVLGGLQLTRERPGTVAVVRFPVSLPDGMRFGSNIGERGGGAPAPHFAVSPDDRWLAYVAYRSGEKAKLWVRRLDTLTPQELPDTDEASFPFWSPDGQFIAFFAQGKLKTIALSGGRPQIICDAPAGEGGTWNGAGDIVFARDQTSPLSRVAAVGGPVTLVTSLDVGTHAVSHRWPQFLPDGRRFIYLAMSGIAAGNSNVLAVASLDSPAPTILVRGTLRAQYASGYLLFPRQSTLMAQGFDPRTLRLTGEPQPVADQVAFNGANGRTAFAVSQAGVLAYRTDSLTDASLLPRPLVWVDRNGHEEPIDAPRRAYLVARLSPDGTRIALAVRDEQNDIWIWDLARRTLQRLTSSRAGQPVWTPDGKRIAFTAERDGVQSMYWQAFDGSGTMERLSSGTQSQVPNSLSPDGTHLIFTTPLGPPFDLGVLALGATRTATMLLYSKASETNGELSPDGRWLAYESDESGRPEIYVRPFPDVESARRQVSTGGGTRPVWSRTGRELFYYVEPGTITAVPVRLGADITLGLPQQVVTGEYAGPVNAWRHYDVSADGQRFLLLKNAPTPDGLKPAISEIYVVINWTEELKRLVPKH